MKNKVRPYTLQRGVMLWLQKRGYKSGEDWHCVVKQFYLDGNAALPERKPLLAASVYASNNFESFKTWVINIYEN